MNVVLNIARPVYMLVFEALRGFIFGFIGIDLYAPFYCFTNGVTSLGALVGVANIYFNNGGRTDDLLQLLDIANNLPRYCNPLNTALISIPSFYNYDSIGIFAKKAGIFGTILMSGVYGGLFYLDYDRITTTYTNLLGNHFDLFNISYLIGKVSNTFFNFMTVYLIQNTYRILG
jgi:hypothetical protein